MSTNEAKVELANGASPVVVASAVVGLPVILTVAVIKADQNEIKASLVSIDARIHANLIQCYLHAQEHGDTSLTRRLLVDIIDAKSGYRRQGVIAHMREFTPMELVGDVIKLTGTINGERKPWRIEQANNTPFTSLASAREMVPMKPVFRDSLTSKIERALKEYKAAIDNTLIENGNVMGPKVPGKPFYNGIRLDEMDTAFDKIEATITEVLSWNDSTQEVFTSRENLKKAELAVVEEAAK